MGSLILWIIMAVVGWVGVSQGSEPNWLFFGMAAIGSLMLFIRICKGFSGDGDFFEDLVDSGSDSFFDGGGSSGGDYGGGGDGGSD